MATAYEEQLRLLKLIEKNTRAQDQEVQHVVRNNGGIVAIELRIVIFRVEDIDTVKQEFTCEFFMAATWEEPRLKGKPENNVDWDEEWDPRLYFDNIVEIKSFEQKHKIFTSNEEEGSPTVQLSFRVKASFKSIFSLHDFPFDYQDLRIVVSSRWNDETVLFETPENDTSHLYEENFPNKQEWELQKDVSYDKDTFGRKSFGKNAQVKMMNYSRYIFKIHIRRKSSFFLINVALIMFMITILCFSAFAIDSSHTANRLSVCLTLLLTAVAFKFVVSGSLPPVPYLTLLDKYVFTCMVFIFLISTENVSAGLISTAMTRKRFEWISFYLSVIAFTLMHILFVVLSAIAIRKTDRSFCRKQEPLQRGLLSEGRKLFTNKWHREYEHV